MTKHELPCAVIADLLPLYQEGLCSPESRELIDAHLETCENCRILSSGLPLPEAAPAAVPEEAEAFRRVRQKTRRGKLLKAANICGAVLLTAFLALNAVWIPLKYVPYKRFCRGFAGSADTGKGTQYAVQSGDYGFRVKMPGYLSFESGFLSVEQADHSDPEKLNGMLYLWPQIGGKTQFGLLIPEPASQTEMVLNQYAVDADLNWLDAENVISGETPEQLQHRKELFEARLDEARGLMDAAKKQWPELF